MAASHYLDRRDAGRRLAAELLAYRGARDVVVLALPRGGVPVGYEVARALGLPLDVLVVRKLGHPVAPELAIGALAEGGVRVLNPQIELPRTVVDAVTATEAAELERRVLAYRARRPALDLAGRSVILVDDGLATGSSMRAAIESARARGARRVVVAVPVAAASTCADLARRCDQLVCPLVPEDLWAVGAWFDDFRQTSDDEVEALLASAAVADSPGTA